VRQSKPGRWRRIPRKTPPPRGITDFRPYLPTFGSIPPVGETRHSILPSETEFEVVVLRKGSEEEKERMERHNLKYIEKAKRLEEMDDDRCDTEEEKVALREFKIDVIRKRRKLRSVNSRSISSVFSAGLPP
jgi:hypothetical protein